MWPALIIPSLIILGATYTDLKSRKIYNWYVLSAIALALINTYAFFGFEGYLDSLSGAGVALLLTLPLVLAKAMGAGDMKLLFALGLSTSHQAVLYTVILAFIWALIFGVINLIVRGELKNFLNNMKLFAFGLKPQSSELHRIPFTSGILLGWISYLITHRSALGGL
jgi:prepilin peptidase CpaA